MPERVQLRRTKGYRKPEGAIVVSRPSKWGNPFYAQSRVENAEAFARHLAAFPQRHGYPGDEEIRAELGGRDLACWCPLDEPCHADTLLAIANKAPTGD